MKSRLKLIIPLCFLGFIAAICVFSACKDKCADGHTWELASTTATCYDSGVKTYKCKNCKETKTENVEAYGHSFVLSSRTEPTCKTNGEEVRKCSRCGFESKQTLLIVDHDYQVKSTTPSTCTVKGSQLLECSMCHETKTEVLELKDHTFELVKTTQSSCIVHGSNQYKCKDCTATKTEELPLGEHKYEVQTVEATCFTHGGTVEKCSVCQDQKPVNETPLLAHNFGIDGYCEHCGIYETLFDIDKLNVTWIKGNDFGQIEGNLVAKFKESNNTLPDSYWKDHTVTLTITMYDKDEQELEKHDFKSTTLPFEGANHGKLTIQYVRTSGELGDFKANQFLIFPDEGNIFSRDSRQNCTSFKIELSCDGYKAIEMTYYIEK